MMEAAVQDLRLLDQEEFRKVAEIQLLLNTRRNDDKMTIWQLLNDLVAAACRTPCLMGIVDDIVEIAIEVMEIDDATLQHDIIPEIPYLSRRWRLELVDTCCIGAIVELLHGYSILDMLFLDTTWPWPRS